MEYDYYKLYLAIDHVYKDMIPCQSLEQVDYELNNAVGYSNYVVIGHSDLYNCDMTVALGDIIVNRTRKRKGR